MKLIIIVTTTILFKSFAEIGALEKILESAIWNSKTSTPKDANGKQAGGDGTPWSSPDPLYRQSQSLSK